MPSASYPAATSLDQVAVTFASSADEHAHEAMYRYRLHRKDLPGRPDLVFIARRKIIFVHGCYWHLHHCRYGQVKPKTNVAFWEEKRRGNVVRDRRNEKALRASGWKVLVIWECAVGDDHRLTIRIRSFLEG